MLILSRHLGEVIRVGEDIYITVVSLNPGTVRLGIDAPRDVSIVREELEALPGKQTGMSVSPGIQAE